MPDLTPTTTTPSPCEFPKFQGDNFCDDENNTEECEYDGGDCCKNNMIGWNQHCSKCECIDPNIMYPDCIDNWQTDFCKQRKEQGKCKSTKVARNCKDTCGFCGCIDIWPAKKCKKNKEKCDTANVAELCKETCNLC